MYYSVPPLPKGLEGLAGRCADYVRRNYYDFGTR
jgi:hypothetical protein